MAGLKGLFYETLHACFILLLAMVVTGCEKEDAGSKDVLEGKCLQARLIASWRCTSAVYVQLLNARTATTTILDGRKYDNVILLSNLPDTLDLGADYSKVFYFTIDTANDFKTCTEVYPCQWIAAEEPYPITIRVCGRGFTTSGCPGPG